MRGRGRPNCGRLSAFNPMRCSRWLSLIGVVVVLGCLQVAQRTAVVMKGYGLGQRLRDVHARETDVSMLSLQITELSSPGRLAKVAKDRQLKLVAWSTIASNKPKTLAALDEAEPFDVSHADDQ